MEKGLISILTPCYNTAAYLPRLLQSVLSQTYPHVEMFAIDDGSTDNTREVVESYVPRFAERGYRLTYVYQDNGGQSVAIRNGLRLVNGQYLVWPDSDDHYADDCALALMVEALERASAEYGMVRTQENAVEDGTMRVKSVYGLNAHEHEPESLFEDCLFARNQYYFPPGAYMVDFAKLQEATTLDIYTDHDAGQNWQLMLPMLYRYRCLTIMQPLYNVVERTSSHSRGTYKGYDRMVQKFYSYEETILETLKRIKGMHDDDRERYSLEIRRKYGLLFLNLSLYASRRSDFRQYYQKAKELGADLCAYQWISPIGGTRFAAFLFKAVNKLKGILSKA